MRPSHRSAARFALVVAVVTSASFVTGSPASAAALTGIVEVTTGRGHACARMANGQARCWGRNLNGQLGDGTKENRGSPVTVSNKNGTGPLTRIARIVAGDDHTCALLTSGQVRCWGRNSRGQLGDGTKDDRTRPVTVRNAAATGPLKNVSAIAGGGEHTCALLDSGQVRCWGYDFYGQLGDGTNDERLRPVVVKDPAGSGRLTGVVGLDAGVTHTCARLASGQARCWGSDGDGELGNGGANSDNPLPVAVRKPAGPGRLTGVSRIDAGASDTCAVLTSGQARCWGDNFKGRVGDGTTDDRDRPVVVRDAAGSGPLTGIAQIVAGGFNTCARLTTRRARCWGDDEHGQLTDGTPSDHGSLPVTVRTDGGGPLSNIVQLAVGYQFVCARLGTGVARCWGLNSEGQLGDGSFAEAHFPVTVIE